MKPPAPARLRIDVVTIFPEYLTPLRQSLLGTAIERGLVEVGVHDLRRWARDAHHSVDDTPYGGGPGMVMRPAPWWDALQQLATDRSRLVVPTPSGRRFTQSVAEELAAEQHLIFACGRYEGIDARVYDAAAERMPVAELSIGDYVLAGGEAATLVIVEAVTRLVPGVVGNAGSIADESFTAGLVEGPVYTRPEVWQGREVPVVLRSGDHAAIARFRRSESVRRTAVNRPDLIAALPADALDEDDRRALDEGGFHLPPTGMAL